MDLLLYMDKYSDWLITYYLQTRLGSIAKQVGPNQVWQQFLALYLDRRTNFRVSLSQQTLFRIVKILLVVQRSSNLYRALYRRSIFPVSGTALFTDNECSD